MSNHSHAAAELTDRAAMIAYVTGGRSVFTLVSKKTGTRFTYQVNTVGKRPVDFDFFVSVLTGPSNTDDYTYMGALKQAGQDGDVLKFSRTYNSRLNSDAPSMLAFSWLCWVLSNQSASLDSFEFWTSGKCCRCARLLTDPVSISFGMGPECRVNAAHGK